MRRSTFVSNYSAVYANLFWRMGGSSSTQRMFYSTTTKSGGKKLHLLFISGSIRKGSSNTGLIRAAAAIADSSMKDKVTYEIANISDIPLYNQDLEEKGFPESVKRVRDQVAKADGILFATPEYNFSVAGVLKNAIDWVSRPSGQNPSPFEGKPAAMMGSGGWKGTARAQYHLRQMAVFLNVFFLNKPEVQFNRFGTNIFDDATGDVKSDDAKKQISALLEALVDWTSKITDK